MHTYISNETNKSGKGPVDIFFYLFLFDSSPFFGCFFCNEFLYGHIFIAIRKRINFITAFCSQIFMDCLNGYAQIIFNPVFLFAHIKTILVSGLTNTRSIYPIPLPSAWMLPGHLAYEWKNTSFVGGEVLRHNAHTLRPALELFLSNPQFWGR